MGGKDALNALQESFNKAVSEEKQTYKKTFSEYCFSTRLHIKKAEASKVVRKELGKAGLSIAKLTALWAVAELYINGHINPKIDKALGITQTNTWKKVKEDIRKEARLLVQNMIILCFSKQKKPTLEQVGDTCMWVILYRRQGLFDIQTRKYLDREFVSLVHLYKELASQSPVSAV